jgi:HK97 family phage prohead protease
MENLEIRYVNELRAIGDSRKITGEAIVFNSLSEPLTSKGREFREIILPGAVDQALLDRSDVKMLYEHDKSVGILARSTNGKGSLKLTRNDNGVSFEFTAKPTALGTEVLEGVRSGDLKGCSFAFKVADGGDKWTRNSDGTYLRTISKIDFLQDTSIVVDPAYSDTSCDVRGLDQLIQTENMDTTNKSCCMNGNTCDVCNNTDCTNNANCSLCGVDCTASIASILAIVTGLAATEATEDAAEKPDTEMNSKPTDQEIELRTYYENLNIKNLKIK